MVSLVSTIMTAEPPASGATSRHLVGNVAAALRPLRIAALASPAAARGRPAAPSRGGCRRESRHCHLCAPSDVPQMVQLHAAGTGSARRSPPSARHRARSRSWRRSPATSPADDPSAVSPAPGRSAPAPTSAAMPHLVRRDRRGRRRGGQRWRQDGARIRDHRQLLVLILGHETLDVSHLSTVGSCRSRPASATAASALGSTISIV